MAGSKRNRQASHQNERLASSMGQGPSRVSKAAGSIGAKDVQMEQRSSMSSSRSTPTAKNALPSAQRQRGNGNSSGRGGNAGRRKPSAGSNRPAPGNAAPAPSGATRDTRFIQWTRQKWNNMEPHHQQRFLGVILLLLSLLLFAALTIFHNVPVFKSLGNFFLVFFGWSAYLLALGLIAFAVAHLIEGIRNIRFIRWSFVIGLIVLWLIVLLESREILGYMKAGVLAELLYTPLQGWHAALLVHVLLIGSFILVAILTFRITFGHVLLLGNGLRRLVIAPQTSGGARGNKGARNSVTGPSPYRGQRPRYSRYVRAQAPNSNDMEEEDAPMQTPRSAQPPQGAGRKVNPNIHLDDEDEGYVDFESDFDADDAFDEDDDPLNDINIHKQQISRIPRGPRQPQPINMAEHKAAVQGAQQQQLPFNPAQARQQKINTANAPQEMEPLAPNPWLNNKGLITPRIPAAESPWLIPDTSLLNRPEEVKLQMLGDDTATLAKTIQDTLRSFKVDAEVKQEDISIGPTVIRFGIRPTGKPEMKIDEKTGKYVPVRDAGGNIVYETRTRVSRIMALQNDLALVLEAKAIRMEAPVPGRPYVGVEIPNKNSRLVTLREVLESKEYATARNKSKLAVALGKDVAGQVRVGDLARMPHLLIAGATGAGKCLAYDESVFLADGRVMKVQDLVGQSVQVVGVTDTQTMQQTPVLATFTENGVQEVFEIKLDNGVILRRTGEHPLWAARLDENQHVGRQSNGKAALRTRAIGAGWVHSKDLRVCGNRPDFDGHVVLTPLALQQKGTISRSDADVILCAALLAEGGLTHYDYLNYNRTPRFTSADAPMVELVATAAKEYDCKLVPSTAKGEATDYYITRNTLKRWEGNPISKLVHEWKINCLATQKTIPSWVFQLPDEQIALFLRVFIDCDGWMSVRDHRSAVSTTLANPVLIKQLGQLALRLGFTGTYTYKENGFAGAWTWTTPMVEKWQESVGSLVKAEKLALAVKDQAESRENAATIWNAWRRAKPTSEQKFANCPDGYEWRKIVSICRITAPTVNIEVHSDNHAFVGYAVEHNSVCINTIIASMLTQASPEDVRLLMVDPKMVELNMYAGITHLLSPVVTEVEKVVPLLKNGITEMERRYRLFSQLGVRNLDGYRKLRAEKIAHNDYSLKNLPAIVIIIDELADLMMAAPEEVEGMICRLAQLARATGIHLVIATQRPSVDVITGLIKANIPTRISFMVSSAVDSRTIIDMGGAERLLGRGDMLYLPADAGRPERIQCCFLADEEAEQLVAYWRQQALEHSMQSDAQPDPAALTTRVEPGWEIKEQASDDFELDDDLLDKAEEVVREYEKASISLLQRRLRIGYSRAARLIDLLEERGIIGPSEASGRSREVLESKGGNSGNGGNGYNGSHSGEGRTMADEVADIIAEEKAREEFLKKQQQSNNAQDDI